MSTIKDELKTLLESSVTVAALSEEDRKLLTDKLMSLNEDEMKQAIALLLEEQKSQMVAMKEMVKKIELAGNNLKKLFLKDKEKKEEKETGAQAEALMEELKNMH